MRNTLILLLMFVQLAALAQSPPNYSVIFKRDMKFVPYRHKDKWGIMTQDKKWVRKPDLKVDSVSLFNYEVAVIKVNNKLGLIDTTGKVVAKPVYARIDYDFENAYYVLKQDDGSIAYFLYDKKVYQQLPDTYDIRYEPTIFEMAYESPDQGKLTLYQNSKGKWGLQSRKKNGEVVASEYEIPALYDELIESENNIYLARKDNKWGAVYIDSKELIPLEYEAIKVTDLGHSLPVLKNGKWGMITVFPAFEVVVPFEYDDIITAPFEEGFGFRLLKDGKMGYYSLDSKKIIPPAFQFIRGFHNDKISPALSAKGKFGYVGLDGYAYFKD